MESEGEIGREKDTREAGFEVYRETLCSFIHQAKMLYKIRMQSELSTAFLAGTLT